MSDKRIGYCLSLAVMLSCTWVIIYGGLMYCEEEVTKKEYDRLYDNYFDLLRDYAELITYLQSNSSLTYQAFLAQKEIKL
jgi:hypothetical protein